MNLKNSVITVSTALALASITIGQTLAITLNDAVQSAIEHNPDALAKLHALRGAQHDINISRAGFYPSVDLSYESNRQKFDYPPGTATSQQYTTRGWSVNLTQNLFQGLQTYHQVKQLDYDSVARYFDFLDTSENLALQTLQAYAEVLLYRQLVQIAKDNYAIHKGILNQISLRVQAGVGRRVDLEQAAGRLALAETNLITDDFNLQDVNARFTRLTGFAAPEDMAALDPLDGLLPKPDDLLKEAIANSPAYLASQAAILSARAEVNARRGAFAPSLDLQLSKTANTDYQGYPGKTRQTSAALILNLNLFHGGTDRARLGSAAEKLNTALDGNASACRNLRQNVTLAYNNVIKFKAQLGSLLQHQLSTEKARNAYRKQFDIGQRTLLDVLDSENELFGARRAYLNAQTQYRIAEASVLANAGKLLPALKLTPLEKPEANDTLRQTGMASCDSQFVSPKLIDVNQIGGRQLGSRGSADNGPDEAATPGLSATISSDQPPEPGTPIPQRPAATPAQPGATVVKPLISIEQAK